MGFTFNVKLPGFNNRVFRARELSGALYRDVVKSLYNADDSAFIDCLNNTCEYIIPGILQEDVNVIDKLLLLLNARAVCVSPDLKLNVTCAATNKQFNYTCKLDELYIQLENLKYTKIVEIEDFIVFHSIIKAQHEKFFFDTNINRSQLPYYQIASCIDSISIKDIKTDFKGLDIETRLSIVENLPVSVFNAVLKSMQNIEINLAGQKLLYIKSPFADSVSVDMPVSTDVHTLLQVCKFIFTDDLTNLYKLVFNLVHHSGFTAEYLDSITPAEQMLFWSYFLKTQQKEQSESNVSSQIAGFPKDVSTSSSEFG
jgi:hypothetical protein